MPTQTMPPHTMPTQKFMSGPFNGVDIHDAFAVAALNETPIVVKLAKVPFPANLTPVPKTFNGIAPGTTITTALNEPTDVLVLLYTDLEISALLDVFTNNSEWTPARKKTWYGYGHNFSTFKPLIKGGEDDALKAGIMGYLLPLTIGSIRVMLYKSELHPKSNGEDMPFIPVIKQLVSELKPKTVISTGTAGGIGSKIQCGDVAITDNARLHLQKTYAAFPTLTDALALKSTPAINDTYIKIAAQQFTPLAVPGLKECYAKIGHRPGYDFLQPPGPASSIYVTGVNPVPGAQPMDIVSADYLTVDDKDDSEGLQELGIMNDTDDAFAFFAISELSAAQQPKWLSIRNASEPQIVVPAFPAGTTPTQIIDKLKSVAGAIYGVYQYCTTLNSAFACWGVIAGMN